MHWTLVSNDLGLRSRRFTIRQLEPETSYELKIKANNPAGSTDFAHSFSTMSSMEAGSRAASGTQLGIGSNFGSNRGSSGDAADFGQLHFIVPLILALLVVLGAIAGLAVCVKRSKFIAVSQHVVTLLLSSFSAEWESLGKREYLQSEDPSQYLNSSQEKKTVDERIYAQVGTLDLAQQPNQIFYNAQFDIDTMGKVPRMC